MELKTRKSDLACLKINQLKIIELKNIITKLIFQWISLIASEERLRTLEDGSKILKIKHGEINKQQTSKNSRNTELR